MLKPIDKNIINNFEYLRGYLTSPGQVTRNDEVGIMNASIGLIDAIIQGKLFVCVDEPEIPGMPEDPPEPAAPEETK